MCLILRSYLATLVVIQILSKHSGGKSTQLSCLSKSKDTLLENDSNKSESQPVKRCLIKCLKVFGFKYT